MTPGGSFGEERGPLNGGLVPEGREGEGLGGPEGGGRENMRRLGMLRIACTGTSIHHRGRRGTEVDP